MKWTLSLDIDVLCRFFLAYTGTAPTNTQAATFANAMATQYSSHLITLCPGVATVTEFIVTDLTSATAAIGTYSASSAGTRSGANLSAGACAMLNLTIGRRYRGGKPRIYLPFGVQPDLTNAQTWGSTFISAMATGWNAFITGLQAAPWSGGTITGQVNVSYYEGFASTQNPVTKRWRNIPTPRATPLTDAVTAVALHPQVASQRRRNRA